MNLYALPHIRHDHRHPESSRFTASPGNFPPQTWFTDDPRASLPFTPSHRFLISPGIPQDHAVPHPLSPQMKNLFNKKKSKPAAMACNHCGAKKGPSRSSPLSRHRFRSTRCYAHFRVFQVKCDAQLGIGKTCRQCLKANRVCEWPPALEQELATASHGSRSSKIRSCATW